MGAAAGEGCIFVTVLFPHHVHRWKFAGTASTNVLQYTKVVYAVHRRRLGLRRRDGDEEVHAPMSLEAAVKDLEDVCQRYADGLKGTNSHSGSMPTLKRLPELLLGRQHLNEWTPEAYEDKELHNDEGIFIQTSSMWGG